MADDEQFSLCWNNFNTNLSAGFHDSLCRGDLVDVTLAAEGQLVKAHRLVLSVCSPYFRKMFTQMPANQHAFVFLKDVSHSALKDLIQFMYCGEVNVKQDALPAFISTAEALQIKGLTETGEGSSAPPHQSPAKEGPSVPSASPRSKQQTRARVQSYKVESEESSDEKVVQVQTQKRTLQRSITPQVTPVTKRAKITADPLESSDPPTVQTVHVVKQQVQQPLQSSEPEYVEMPMETINPKSEPEYVEDTSEIEAAEQEHDQDTETHELQEQDDTTYVEDESYGDIKYDESYFNENDEAKAGVSGFSESYTEGGDQSASEAQVLNQISSLKERLRKIMNKNNRVRKNVSHPLKRIFIEHDIPGFRFPLSTKEQVEELEEEIQINATLRRAYIRFLQRKKNPYQTISEFFPRVMKDSAIQHYTYAGHQDPHREALKDCKIFTDCMLEAWFDEQLTEEKLKEELTRAVRLSRRRVMAIKARRKKKEEEEHGGASD